MLFRSVVPFGWDGTWALAWSPDGSKIVYVEGDYPGAESSGWVQEDLFAAELLLFGLALAVLGILIAALGAPIGSFTTVLAIVALEPAFASGDWRYIPAAIIGGLITDGIVRSVRLRWRPRVAAAAFAGIGILSFLLAIGAGGTLVWSVTLVFGVAVASALLGWALGELVERLPARAPRGTPNA